MRRYDHIADVEAFVAVAEHGSFTSGAVALATTASVLSRAVARLERRLGAQLIRRTTRRLSLTNDGRAYLEQAGGAFALIDDAERALGGQAGSLSGRVRLSVATTYAHYRLPQKLARFAAAHPDVSFEVNIANRNVDLIADGFDIAIRAGQLPDSGLIGRKLEDARFSLVAAPEYISQAGAPVSLDDLARHVCLPFVMPSTGRPIPWLFSIDGQDVDWMPSGPIQVQDDVLGVVSLAQAGAGICQTYDFIVAERIARGELIKVMPQYDGRTRPFSVVYAPHRNLPAATRAFVEALVE